MPHYPVLVYGATLTGLGIAQAAREQTLVVERTSLVGHEFIASYRPGTNWERQPNEVPAQELRTELIERNLLSESGRVHLPGIAPVLFHWIRSRSLQVRMMTEIVHVAPHERGYIVTLHNASGLQQTTVGKLIDTTSTFQSDPHYAAPIAARSLNAILHADVALDEPPLPAVDGSVRFAAGRFPGEATMHFPLEADEGWAEAREKLTRYWLERARSCEPWTLAAIADVFDYIPGEAELSVADQWLWFPSAAHANLVSAFEAGYLKGGTIHEAVATGQ